MSKRFYLRRLIRYYQENGLRGTLRRLVIAIRRGLYDNKTVLFYIDLQCTEAAGPILPATFGLEAVNHYSQLQSYDLERIFDHLGKYRTEHELHDRLEKGANLWLLRVEHKLAALIWSIRGKMTEPYFLPLMADDAVLFAAETFPDYRGRGLYPLLVECVFGELKKQKVVRVYGMAATWNAASLRGLAKTRFRHYGKASMLHLQDKTITVWYHRHGKHGSMNERRDDSYTREPPPG